MASRSNSRCPNIRLDAVSHNFLAHSRADPASQQRGGQHPQVSEVRPSRDRDPQDLAGLAADFSTSPSRAGSALTDWMRTRSPRSSRRPGMRSRTRAFRSVMEVTLRVL